MLGIGLELVWNLKNNPIWKQSGKMAPKIDLWNLNFTAWNYRPK